MLKIEVITEEGFDDNTQEFVTMDSFTLTLEHSLVSLSKWEAKWKKPFFSSQEKTVEETLDYIRCMSMEEITSDDILKLSEENMKDISEYINSSESATTIREDPSDKGKINNEIITSELIYYWMVAHQINWEAQHWHLNRLITLVRVCNLKNQPESKKTPRSRRELLEERQRLNQERRKQFNTEG